MSSRNGLTPWLGKRVNLMAPLGIARAVDVAQWMLGARRPIAIQPPAAPVPLPESERAATRWSPIYAALVNLAVLLIVAGLATAVSAHLFAIPVPLLVTVFAVACAVLLRAGVRAAARGSSAAVILCAWAALAFGLLVFAGAQLAGWTGFVPDLVLVWLAGVLMLALAVPGTGLLTLTSATVVVWVSLAYLYDRSYLPAVAALAALFWAAFRRPVSGAFVAALTLATVVVGAAYFHDVVRPGHYPLALGAGELLFVMAVIGAVGALWSVMGVGPEISRAARRTVRAFGYVLLAIIAVPPVWERIRDGFDHGSAAFTAGTALLAFAGIFVWSIPARARDRLLFLESVVKFGLLAAALYGVPGWLGSAAPVLAAGAIALIAYRLAARGAARRDGVRALAGALLLVAVAVPALAARPAPMEAVAAVLVATGVIVARIAGRWEAPGALEAAGD